MRAGVVGGVFRPGARPARARGHGAAAIRPDAGRRLLGFRRALPDEPAIIDELGVLTFSRGAPALQRARQRLSDAGVVEGDGVGVMCRNHRGFIETLVACPSWERTRSTSTPRSPLRS